MMSYVTEEKILQEIEHKVSGLSGMAIKNMLKQFFNEHGKEITVGDIMTQLTKLEEDVRTAKEVVRQFAHK